MPAEPERRVEERDVDAMREEDPDDSGLAKIRPLGGGRRGIARVFCALSIDGAMVKASEGAESAARKRQSAVPVIHVISTSISLENDHGPASVSNSDG